MTGIKNAYETVIVTSANLGEEGNTALIEKFKELINKNGVVESVDDWGKRRFAYPIEKQNEGFYTLINFTADTDFITELDRRYVITDGILRTLIIKKEEKKVKPKKASKVSVKKVAVENTEAQTAEAAE